MRAFVLSGPGRSAVQQVPEPSAAAGQVVVDVERVGVCGTDVEFFTGEMAYLREGSASFPMRLGHEWCGTVASVGPGVDRAWLGRRVTGDTMLGCGHCARCRSGRQHVCADRFEIGIRGGFAGALAEQLAVPVSALHALPDTVDPVAGALVEPGGNALRAVNAAQIADGDDVLVLGAGAIGVLIALFARARGARVQLLDRSERARAFARSQGFPVAASTGELPTRPWAAVLDASTAEAFPGLALDVVEPGGHVVCIGLAGTPSLIDTRVMVLKDVTAVGILSASPGLAGTIEQYATAAVDPRPLVATTVGLDRVGDVLAGWRPPDAGAGPKIHVDPRT